VALKLYKLSDNERIVSRIKPELKERLRREAFELGITLNAYIVLVLQNSSVNIFSKGDEKQ